MTVLQGAKNRTSRIRRIISSRSILVAIPVVFLLIFFTVPIVQMITLSFQTYHPTKLVVPVFTLQNYLAIVNDSYITNILFRTINVALATTAICAVLAYPIAFRMRQATGLEKMVLTLIVLTPLMISLIVLGYAWVVILAPNTGLLNRTLGAIGLPTAKVMFTPAGIVVGLVYSNLVFMVLSLHASLENIDESLLRGARVLGANAYQVFRGVVLPLSLPGLVSGSLIVFSVSASSFVIPLLIGGRQQPVMATYAWDMASYLLNWPMAATIAAVLVIIAGSTNLGYTSWIYSLEKRLGILDEQDAG